MRYFIFFIFSCVGVLSLGQNAVQIVTDVQYTFNPRPITSLNTQNSEFGPVWFDYNIIFASTREHDYLNLGENQWKKKKQYNLYVAQMAVEEGQLMSDSIAQLKFFDDQLNHYLHTGPACYSMTGDTLFFTQVIKTKKRNKKIYRPVLFVTFKKKNGEFSRPEQLQFIDPQYNYAHPAFDSFERCLYFSSNCDSTRDDEDIYSVRWKEDGTWTTPENLGEAVNTTHDEMFPFIFNGNELFFASEREEGMGGLDLYWSYKGKEGWHNTRNLGPSINSDKDDFSFSMHENGKVCFFASEQSGNDDLFFSKVNRKIITRKRGQIKGQFVFRHLKKDAFGLEVQLIDNDGIVMDETTTDSSGNFYFDKLVGDQSFIIKTKGNEDDELILKIYDKNGKKIAVLLSNDSEEYAYKKLERDEADILSLLETVEDEFDLEGQFLYEKLPGEFPNGLEVKIVNEDDEVLYTTKTDELGNFKFKKLSGDQKMYLTLNAAASDDFILLIYNNKGDVIARLTRGDDDEFNYRRLHGDYQNNLELITAQEEDIVMSDSYKSITGEIDFKKLDGFFEDGLTVVAYNDQLEPIDTTTTSPTGTFVFKKLAKDETVLFFKVIDADSYNEDDLFLYITNAKGEKVVKLVKNGDNMFAYRPLADDQATLHTKEDDEDEILFEEEHEKETTIMSKEIAENSIFFDVNSSYFNTRNRVKLNKILTELKNQSGTIAVNSYADSRAPSEYNMWLSERRSQRVVDYLIQNGIPADRIVQNHYGESRLFNDCEDGVDCPEEQHQLNRRTEIVLQK